MFIILKSRRKNYRHVERSRIISVLHYKSFYGTCVLKHTFSQSICCGQNIWAFTVSLHSECDSRFFLPEIKDQRSEIEGLSRVHPQRVHKGGYDSRYTRYSVAKTRINMRTWESLSVSTNQSPSA